MQRESLGQKLTRKRKANIARSLFGYKDPSAQPKLKFEMAEEEKLCKESKILS